MDTSYLVMVLFLVAGTCANLPYLVRSTLDCFIPSRPLARTMPAAAPVLFTTALSELAWVLPCLIQCAIQLFNGSGPWSPANSGIGCDIMATYSVFASVAAMTSTLWVAYLTYRSAGGEAANVSFRTSAIVCVALVAGSAFVAALPFMGAGAYAYSGEGFCYIDWHDPVSAAVMLVITLPTICATMLLLGLAVHKGGWPSSLDLWLMGLAFLSAWVLWVPASVIGLSGAQFPQHFMITGGFFGHAQAIINPYVYGLRWRASALKLGGGSKSQIVTPKLTEAAGSTAGELAVTPSTVSVVESPA